MLQNSDMWKQQMICLMIYASHQSLLAVVTPVPQVYSSCNWISMTAEIVVCRQSKVRGQQLYCWDQLHVHTRLELHVLIVTDVEFDLAIWSPH